MARILVVDDDKANRELVLTILREEGYTVDGASSGADALAQLDANTFNLLLTDMHMPEMDGVELISQCRDLHPDMPIVAISGGDFAGDTSRLADAGLMGAVETVNKPFKVEDLYGAVERALSGSKSESS